MELGREKACSLSAYKGFCSCDLQGQAMILGMARYSCVRAHYMASPLDPESSVMTREESNKFV